MILKAGRTNDENPRNWLTHTLHRDTIMKVEMNKFFGAGCNSRPTVTWQQEVRELF